MRPDAYYLNQFSVVSAYCPCIHVFRVHGGLVGREVEGSISASAVKCLWLPHYIGYVTQEASV